VSYTDPLGACVNTKFFATWAGIVLVVGFHHFVLFSSAFASYTSMLPSGFTPVTIPVCQVLPYTVSTFCTKIPPMTGHAASHIASAHFTLSSYELPSHHFVPVTIWI
jgi:hypothetical protein